MAPGSHRAQGWGASASFLQAVAATSERGGALAPSRPGCVQEVCRREQGGRAAAAPRLRAQTAAHLLPPLLPEASAADSSLQQTPAQRPDAIG